MITIRGFTITYKNAAFLGVGFCLGYAQALRDSDAILQRLDDILAVAYANVAPEEDPEEAAERKAKAEAIDGTAVVVVREIEETPKESQPT